MPTDAIKDSGQRTEFDTGAVRDMHEGKGRYDLLPWEAIHEVAKHCEAGAAKYGERNCEKGIPMHSLIDSALRHLGCYLRGMDDEPHLRAAAWNVLFAIWTEIKHPEMQDIPCRLKVEKNSNRLSPVKKFLELGTEIIYERENGSVDDVDNTRHHFCLYSDGSSWQGNLEVEAEHVVDLQDTHGPIVEIRALYSDEMLNKKEK